MKFQTLDYFPYEREQCFFFSSKQKPRQFLRQVAACISVVNRVVYNIHGPHSLLPAFQIGCLSLKKMALMIRTSVGELYACSGSLTVGV